MGTVSKPRVGVWFCLMHMLLVRRKPTGLSQLPQDGTSDIDHLEFGDQGKLSWHPDGWQHPVEITAASCWSWGEICKINVAVFAAEFLLPSKRSQSMS